MVTLDNLVVTTALPVIRKDLGAGIEGLEWTVNAYTLTFAVLLLTGAALGDRFGRRRMFAIGLGIFTGGLCRRRARARRSTRSSPPARPQGVGGAIIAPLTLTLLSAAVPGREAWARARRLERDRRPRGRARPARRRRGRLRSLLAVDLLDQRPARPRPDPAGAGGASTRATARPNRLDLPGVALASLGLLGIVWGLVRGNGQGWSSPEIVSSLVAGAVLVVALRPLGAAHAGRRCCRCASSATAPSRRRTSRRCSCSSGCSARSSCSPSSSRRCRATRRSRLRPADPAVDGDADLRRPDRRRALRPDRRAAADGPRARAAGGRARLDGRDRLGDAPYADFVVPFVISGIGMALFFAPVANVVLSAVQPEEEGQASGANNAIRELGGVFGVAVLASVFSQLRRLRVRPGLRRRARAGALGRRSRRRARGRRGADDPAPPAAAGGARAGARHGLSRAFPA